MKKLLITSVIICSSLSLFAQKIYKTTYKSEADEIAGKYIKIYGEQNHHIFQ